MNNNAKRKFNMPYDQKTSLLGSHGKTKVILPCSGQGDLYDEKEITMYALPVFSMEITFLIQLNRSLSMYLSAMLTMISHRKNVLRKVLLALSLKLQGGLNAQHGYLPERYCKKAAPFIPIAVAAMLGEFPTQDTKC
jgi:hypothetical protein